MVPTPVREKKYDNVTVKIFANKEDLGRAAAAAAAEHIAALQTQEDRVNLMFSTGASQFEFVAALKDHKEIDWSRVNGFHLDEYIDMDDQHPASFRLWLRTRVEEPFQPGKFYYIEGDAEDTEAEIQRYARLLEENPIDLGFIGIGENGHIAFNDPPVADFEDPKAVKVVELDEACRRQQLGEGWFPTLEDVPRYAISLTIPSIMKCKKIISVVPDGRKAEAVRKALEGPIETACPASILRTHPDVTIFLDQDSASLLSD
ncbi:MAG: glucosamine-6-phosphate deaminase [Firmicutes bacterium]|nr:glucosamine-6-phosphate deaminase [Bacillota bacterium]